MLLKVIWGKMKAERRIVTLVIEEREARLQLTQEESRDRGRVEETRISAKNSLIAWLRRVASKRERDEVRTERRQEIETIAEARSSKVRRKNAQKGTVILTSQHVYWEAREAVGERPMVWGDTGIG